jgi:TP901 family phage tail tape measure protein
MAKGLALGLVIGGAVSASVGKAFNDVEGRIKRLDSAAAKTRVLQSVVGETKKLQEEWRKAHLTGSAAADGLRRKLDASLDGLRRQGVEVRNLGKAYVDLERKARAAELKSAGRNQIKEGGQGLRKTGAAVAVGVAALAVPTMVSANYEAQIRQIALWAHTAGTDDEVRLAKAISDVAAAKGMSQQALAQAVGGLVEKGIDWEESAEYAPLIADLINGQGMEQATVATLFSAFKEAGVKKEEMGAMMGQVAAAGDIGAFGPKDMARYMPQLLGTIKRLGMEGPEAVRFLGASLQSQYKQTQDSASAATNMNNLLNAVISSTSQERFAKEGYDLAGSINALTKSGKAENPVDAFIMLTSQLVKKQDPAKAKQVEALKAKVKASADGSAEQEQAMVALIEAAGLATIVSDQSASDGLLAQIKYGSTIKDDMATIKATDGKAKIESDAAKAQEVSKAKWQAATNSIEGSLTSIGQAIKPFSDAAADGLTAVLGGLKRITDESPKLVSGAVMIAGAVAAGAAAFQAFKIARGVMNIGRGTLMGNPNVVQKVEVVNGLGLGGGSGGPAAGSGGSARSGGRRRWWNRGRGRGRSTAPAAPIETAKPRMRVYSNGAPASAQPGALSSWKPPVGTPSPGTGMSLVPKGPTAPRINTGGQGRGSLPFELLSAGFRAKEVYDTAETRDEKAEGYGEVAGTLAGTLAGAAAGAAIGSVVPIIGTAIGGMIGAYLGSAGGGALGGYAGKAFFGGPDPASAAPITPMLARARPGPAVPSLGEFASAYGPGVTRNGQSGSVLAELMKKPDAQTSALMAKPAPPAQVEPTRVEQSNTFAPVFQINVHGDVKDPQQLINQLMPEIQRKLDDQARLTSRRSMSDESHS